MSFDLPVQVELSKLSTLYSDNKDRHWFKFCISRDLWLKFEMPEPGKILRGLWWRKGDNVVEEIEFRNYIPGFRPGFDPKRPDANANTYNVTFEVTEEVWNLYKPWKKSDYSGVLWGASDDEFDQAIVTKWREKLIARAKADAESVVEPVKKEKKVKEKSPFGTFWRGLDTALEKGLVHNPAFTALIRQEAASPLGVPVTPDDARSVIRASMGVTSRKTVAPDEFVAWLKGRGMEDRNFLLQVERLAEQSTGVGIG